MLDANQVPGPEATPASGHPGADELKQFGTGGTEDDQRAETIALHLESCPECTAIVRDSSPDGVLKELASLLGESPDDAKDGPRLKLLEEIGRGGNGVVYRAHHRSLDRDLAVKMLIQGTRASGQELARFRKEARALARLDHPGIVRVHDFGELDGAPFLAMELVAGPTLAERLRRGPLDIRLAARWTRDLALAVAHAHAAGIHHRDLKPQNVLLETRENAAGSSASQTVLTGVSGDACQPRIVDFGLVKFSEGEGLRTATGGLLGTPAYLAPEIIGRGTSRADVVAVDIYGLGTLFYECLTGQPPYTGSSQAELLQSVATRSPAPVRSIRPGIPPELVVICEKCLAREPGARFASATALADELGRFLEGKPILSRPPSAAMRFRLWCRRKPWPALAAGLAMLVGLGAPAAAIWHSARLQHEQRQAQQRYESARKAVWRMLDLFSAGDAESVPQVTSLMAREAAEARQLFAELAIADPGGRAQLDLARVNMLCGTLAATLGRAEEAEARLDEALVICRGLRDDPDVSADALEQLAAALTKRGAASTPDRNPERARECLEEAVAIQRDIVRRQPEPANRQSALAWSLMNLGGWHQGQGQMAEALKRTEESVSILERLVAGGKADDQLIASLAGIRVNLASQLQGVGKTELAGDQFRRAISELELQLERKPASREIAGDLAAALLNYSNLQAGSGALNEAADSCAHATRIVSAALEREPEHLFLKQHLFMTTANRALWLGAADRHADAEAAWGEAMASALDDGNRTYCRQMRANCLAQDRRGTEAAEVLGHVDLDGLASDGLFRQALGWALIADVLVEGGDPAMREQARVAEQDASEILRRLKQEGALASEEFRNHLRDEPAWKTVRAVWSPADWDKLTAE